MLGASIMSTGWFGGLWWVRGRWGGGGRNALERGFSIAFGKVACGGHARHCGRVAGKRGRSVRNNVIGSQWSRRGF